MINYTFIIPHKNCPDLLNRCVDSIPVRDDVQIIVVDDNSDEGKKPDIKRKDIEVVLLDASQSKGAGRARNIGLKHATGKWLLFADADDYYSNNFMNVLDRYSNKDFDVLYFNFLYKEGKTGRSLSQLSKIQSLIAEYDSTKESSDVIKFRFNVPWNKMISHDYVNQFHFYFEEVPNGNDIFFSKCIGYHTDNVCVEKIPIYVYIKNENSIVTAKRSIEGEICRLEHLIKLNNFYEFIGYEEWKKSVVKALVKKCRLFGFPFIKTLIESCFRLYKERKDWVKKIPSFSRTGM